MYERAIAIELERRRVPFARQVTERLEYKGIEIGEFRIDLVIDGRVIVEIKAVEAISATHIVQSLSYLAITGLELALVLNFNVPVISQGVRRIVPRFQ